MKDVENLIKKIIKKSKDKEANYLYGVEYANDSDPAFRCVIRFSKEGVTPVVIGTTSKRELKKTLQSILDGAEVKDVVVMYHEAQINNIGSAIRFHRKAIEDYEAGKEVEEFNENPPA